MLQSPSSAIFNVVASTLGKLEQNPIGDTMAKEVLGINAPKITFTRTKDERIDAAVSEIGNTVAFAAGGITLDFILKRAFKRALSQPNINRALAERWSVFSRSFALSSLIFSLLWVMPFVRNYVTARRIGTDRFTTVIGADKSENTQAKKDSLKRSLAIYKKKIIAILSLGVGGAALFSGLGLLAIKNSTKNVGAKFLQAFFPEAVQNTAQAAEGVVKKTLRKVPPALLIENGSFDKFAGWPALLFWGVPAYGGWIHASRDSYEKKEQLLKFANFTLAFFGPSLVLGKFFKKQFDQKFPELESKMTYEAIQKVYANDAGKLNKALKLWATKNGLSLFSSIIFLGTLPQLLNIYLTKKRIENRHFHAEI